jgi:hypothetical protein
VEAKMQALTTITPLTVYDRPSSTPRERARQAVDLAFELIDAVERNHRADIQCVLDRAETNALCLVLAAMHDEGRSVKAMLRDVPGLLGWLEQPRSRRAHGKPLRPCGTHAAFVRHKNRGEDVDPACAEAEKAYQRERSRSQRAAARSLPVEAVSA